MKSKKRSLAELTQGEVELIRASACDSARDAMIELGVSTGAAAFCGIYDYIEAGVNSAVSEAMKLTDEAKANGRAGFIGTSAYLLD